MLRKVLFCSRSTNQSICSVFSGGRVLGSRKNTNNLNAAFVDLYVYMVITYRKSKDQPGKVANPVRGQLTGKMNISLSPFAPENLISRNGFGIPVPRQPSHLHTQAGSGAYLRDSSRFPRRRLFIYLNRNTPSGQSRVYRATQLHTDGVHCRESTCTGPVNLVSGTRASDHTLTPLL